VSGGKSCICKVRNPNNWVVVHRNHNHSAFETPKYEAHWSRYSKIHCKVCGMAWSSDAAYVLALADEEK